MKVFYIQFTKKNVYGKPIWILLETSIGSIEEITEHLNAGRLVHGFELKTKPCKDDPENSREVTGVREVSFRLEEVKEIGIPRWDLYRVEA